MTPEKIIAVVEMYEGILRNGGIPKERMDPKRPLASLHKRDLLEHAHYLCDGVKEYARNPDQYGKANRHLASIQMILSFAGVYTLENLMNHNRPDTGVTPAETAP